MPITPAARREWRVYFISMPKVTMLRRGAIRHGSLAKTYTIADPDNTIHRQPGDNARGNGAMPIEQY